MQNGGYYVDNFPWVKSILWKTGRFKQFDLHHMQPDLNPVWSGFHPRVRR